MFMGDLPKLNRCETCSMSHAHMICSYTESASVLPTLRNTTALAFGFAMMSRTMAMLMKLDFVELRPPLNQ